MKSKQLLFFTTASDIEPIMIYIESVCSIEYYKMGLFDDKLDKRISSVSEIPDFGQPKFGDWNRDLRLMMMPRDSSLTIREVPQRKGGIKYAVDPSENQISICFQFGGIYKEGILLAGSCGTVSINEFSSNIFRLFSTEIRKRFRKIEAFYVGKNAEEKLRQGWRLVTDEKFSKDYDLIWK